jgi:PASTA domain
VLEQPVYPYFWGGESSAIVFRRVIEGINLATDIFCDDVGSRIAAGRDVRGKIPTPSFLRLHPDEARDLASRYGLTIRCPEGSGTVYSQIPDPGTLVGRDAEVKLILGKDQPQSGALVSVPNLCGISIREARRLLLAVGLGSSVEGYGVVVRHEPGAGVPVAIGSKVTLYCGPRSEGKNPGAIALANGVGN